MWRRAGRLPPPERVVGYDARSMRGTFLLVVLAAASLLASACSRPADVSHEVEVSGLILVEGMSVEILADGHLVASRVSEPQFESKSASVEVKGVLRGDEYRVPALRLRVLFAGGWREFPISLNTIPDAKTARQALESHTTLRSGASCPYWDRTLGSLWVDNRGRPAGKLRCGALEFAIPADTAARLSLYLEPTPVPVQFDGAPMGDIPGHPNAREGTVVIDPSGKHAYSYSTVWYGKEGGGRSEPERWAGKHVYHVAEHVAYVLEDAPAMTMARQGDVPTYHVLVDAKGN
jgi:hypothetical protein